jgi:hypothetical protein
MYIVMAKDAASNPSALDLQFDDEDVPFFVRAVQGTGYWDTHLLLKVEDPKSFLEFTPKEIARQVWAETPNSHHAPDRKNKIWAIKELRAKLNLGLKEAKDLIDTIKDEPSSTPFILRLGEEPID